MKITGLLAVLLVVLGLGGWVYSNRQERLRWDAQYKGTTAAYKRAIDYVNAGTLLYEPRFLDLQKAVDELAAMTRPYYGSGDTSRRAEMIHGMEVCQLKLADYRDSGELSRQYMEAQDFGPMLKAEERKGAELRDVYYCADNGEPDYAHQKDDKLRKFAVEHGAMENSAP